MKFLKWLFCCLFCFLNTHTFSDFCGLHLKTPKPMCYRLGCSLLGEGFIGRWLYHFTVHHVVTLSFAMLFLPGYRAKTNTTSLLRTSASEAMNQNKHLYLSGTCQSWPIHAQVRSDGYHGNHIHCIMQPQGSVNFYLPVVTQFTLRSWTLYSPFSIWMEVWGHGTVYQQLSMHSVDSPSTACIPCQIPLPTPTPLSSTDGQKPWL